MLHTVPMKFSFVFQMAYAIALFCDTDEVAIVCSKWIIHSEPIKKCRWPSNVSATGLKNCLILEADPAGWPSYDVRILCPDIGEYKYACS